MQKKATEPSIRFAGFRNGWEKRKFDSIFTFLNNNTLSRAFMRDEGAGTKNIHYGDILVKFGECLNVSKDGLPCIKNDAIVATARNSTLKDGDVIFADTAEDETAGKCVEIYNVKEENVLAGLHTIPCRPSISFGNAYLGYCLNSVAFHAQLLSLMQGIKVLSISKNALSSTNLTFPLDKIEQARIGNFFLLMDDLITFHQRKYEKLVNLKKAMLDKMFPKNGELVPEVRFSGFSGNWERRRIEELLVERNQQFPKSAEYPLMAFIAEEGVSPKGDRYDRSALVNDAENKLYKRTEFGDFIYSSNNLETGSIGLNNFGRACISPVYSIFYPTDLANSNFLGCRLVMPNFINEMVRWRQGVIYGQWRIHESDFFKISIIVPNLEEQGKIGDFFCSLDNAIRVYRRKTNLLQNIKLAFLEKMFV